MRNAVRRDDDPYATCGTVLKRWFNGFFDKLDVANGSNSAINTLQRSTAYAVGAMVASNILNAKFRLICIAAGTTDTTEPDLTSATTGDTITDGTVTWVVEKFITTSDDDVGDPDIPVYLSGGKITSIGATLFQKIVTHLASSTAASISSLNTSSLFYRMLSWALTAAGVQYNFNNSSAWYICFGSLFGGLIIQGGTTGVPASDTTKMIAFPVSFSKGPGMGLGSGNWTTDTWGLSGIRLVRISGTEANVKWIAIGS